MNDPTAQMGVQLGKSAVEAGQQYMEQNVSVQVDGLNMGMPRAYFRAGNVH